MKDFVRQPPQRNSPVKCTAVDCKYNVCFRCRYPAALQFQRVIGAWEAPICKWWQPIRMPFLHPGKGIFIRHKIWRMKENRGMGSKNAETQKILKTLRF